MRKTQLDFSASVANQQVVSLANTHWVGTCANVTERHFGTALEPLEEPNEKW